MKPRAVVWDIDDILTPTSESFYRTALRTHGQCIHPNHWSDYLWGKHIGMDEGLETQQYLIDHRIIETCEPYYYTPQALALTHQAGFKNVLLSARAWHPDPVTVTQEWLQRFNVGNVDAMHFVKVDESKKDTLVRLLDQYDIKAFVEDNPAHAKSCPVEIPHVYLVRRRWNKDWQKDPRFHCVSTAHDAAVMISLISK